MIGLAKRALRALSRRAGDISAKLAGREPYLRWSRIISDWFSGLRVLVQPGRLHAPIPAPERRTRCVCERGEFVEIETSQGDRLVWPKRLGSDLIEQVVDELQPDNPHNYFSLYAPLPEHVVFDVGACEGLFTARLLGRVARVYAIEPVPEIAHCLEATFAEAIARGEVSIHQLVFGDAEGEIELLVNASRPECSTIGSDLTVYSDSERFEGVVVRVRTIDEFVAEHGLTRLDCVKLDIESAEMSALRGATRTLKELKPDLLVAVYHEIEDIRSIPSFLESFGYEIAVGPLTYYPDVRVASPADVPRPHYRPHLILARSADKRRVAAQATETVR